MKVVALTDSPLNTDILDPARMADAINAARSRRRRHRHRPAPVLQHAQPGDLRRSPTASSCRSRRTCRPSGPPSSCATSRSGSAAASDWRWSSTGPTAALSVADMERTVGMPAPRAHPVGRTALRPRRQRGPDRDRDVPEGEDHDGLRGPRRSCPRDADHRPRGEGRLPDRGPAPSARPRLTPPAAVAADDQRAGSSAGPVGPVGPAHRRAGQLLVALSRPHVDLFDAADVLAIDEDRRRRLRSRRGVSPIIAVASTTGTNISDDRLSRLSGSDPGCRKTVPMTR